MAIAYGSITLVDIDDLGQLSVVPESNQPGTIIYDPNTTTNQYLPDWSKSNLILTPVIYYGGVQKVQGDIGITVSWMKKINGVEENLNSEANGKLIVNTNPFASNISQITYICTVTYSDPIIMGSHSLTAKGQITFSLVKNASEVRTVGITGESVFLYKSAENIPHNADKIILTARLNGLNLKAWEVKKPEGWQVIEQATSNELNVFYNETDYFVNDVATFRVTTTHPLTGEDDISDVHTITNIRDGQKGDQGDPGLSFLLGNYQDVIPCSENGYTLKEFQAVIPFSAYKGSEQISCELSIPNKPSYIKDEIIHNGVLYLIFMANNSLDGLNKGEISIVLTADNTSSTQSYSWVKNLKAKDGLDAVVLQINTPNGNVISNGENEVVLEAKLVSGINDITSSATYSWSKWDGSSYNIISGQTGSSIVISPSMIESYNSFQCTATYKTKTYKSYQSVYDKTDPLQVYIESTLGDKLLNSSGQGMVYARVYRNNEEIDPLMTTKYGTELPQADRTPYGTYFYYINTAEKKVELKQRRTLQDTPEWLTVDGQNVCTYKWTLRDKNGQIFGEPRYEKAIYIDGSIIDTKTTFDIEVTI